MFYSRLLNKSIIRIEHADVPLDDEEDADRNLDEVNIIFLFLELTWEGGDDCLFKRHTVRTFSIQLKLFVWPQEP